MDITAVDAIHPHWKGRLLFSKQSGTVVHEQQGSKGTFVWDSKVVRVTWQEYGVDVFNISPLGLLIHESVTAVDAEWLLGVSFAMKTFPVSKITVVLPENGYPVTLRAGTSDTAVFTQIFAHKDYESEWLPHEAKVVVDLGGNIGLAALFFALRYPNAKVFSVEPDQENFRALQANIEGLSERILPMRGAVWINDGEINLVSEAEGGANLGSWGMQVSSVANKNAQKTPCWKILTLMQIFKIDHIDILKVDIEGAELELFSTNADEWLKHVSLIIVETHDRFRSGSHAAVMDALANRFDQLPSVGENLFFRKKHLSNSRSTPV